MPTLPNADEMHKFQQQANEAARTPLLAALGAGDLAAQTVVETVNKLRDQLAQQAESARSGVGDAEEWRERLDPAELRKQLDAYTRSAKEFYGYLAERGEGTLGRIQSQPGVKRARDQVDFAQGRFEEAVEEVRELADDVLGKVTTSTRSFGERAAESAQSTAEETAETVRSTADDTARTVTDIGSKTATATRSTSRKAANQAAAAKSTESHQATDSSKNGGPKNSSSKNSSTKNNSGKQSKSDSSKNNSH